MRLISSLLKSIFFIILGYWLAVSQVASGTPIGDGLDWVLDYLPVTSDFWDQNDQEPELDQASRQEVSHQAGGQDLTSLDIDDQLLREQILDLTNQTRADQGLPPLSQNSDLELAGDIRAQETVTSFSHTRPDGQDFFTVLQDSEAPPNYQYQVIGENLAMATYHIDDAHMARYIFQGWLDSQGHYENIINPSYTQMGVGVAYAEGILYLTQFFGHPMP